MPEGVWLALHRRACSPLLVRNMHGRERWESVSQEFPGTAAISGVFTPRLHGHYLSFHP